MKKLILLFLLTFGAFTMASASSYVVDAQAIDNLIASSTEVEMVSFAETAFDLEANFMAAANPATSVRSADEGLIAFILCWVLGYLGVHRIYMGTNAGVIIGYILTGGGCGILVLVDWIMLLLKLINSESISEYQDCTRFFMWTC